jgi:hypothetical protein
MTEVVRRENVRTMKKVRRKTREGLSVGIIESRDARRLFFFI